FESTKDKGTVWLTHKRLMTHDGEDATMDDADPNGKKEYLCLICVTHGKKANFSMHVISSDPPKFHTAYGSLLKASFMTLRKRDKKCEKLCTEQLTKRKQHMAEPVVISGPKHGNGQRKRQRKVKAVIKQEQAKERSAKREDEGAKAQRLVP
ncbi:signal recognition particle SRP9 SRP14 subunit, partial [Imleria badia]